MLVLVTVLMRLDVMTHVVMLVIPMITGMLVIVCSSLPWVTVFVRVGMTMLVAVGMAMDMGMSFAPM